MPFKRLYSQSFEKKCACFWPGSGFSYFSPGRARKSLRKNETNIRKILNFGHTLGHAIETHCLNNTHKTTLLHGEAIAIGMITEAYLATKLCGLNPEVANKIKNAFLGIFEKVNFSKNDLNSISDLLIYDKKNSHGKVKFVLLQELGKPLIDIEVPSDNLLDAFKFYQQD